MKEPKGSKEPKKFEGQYHTTQKPFLWIKSRILDGESFYEEELNRIFALIFPAKENEQFLYSRENMRNLWFSSLYHTIPTLDPAEFPAFKHFVETDSRMRFVGFREKNLKTGEVLRGWKILRSNIDYRKKLHKDITIAGSHKAKNLEIATTGLALFPRDVELAELAYQRNLLYAGHANAGSPEAMNTSDYSIFNEDPEEILRLAKEQLSEEKFKRVAKLFFKEVVPDF